MTRPKPPAIPLQADERTTLVAFLEFYRAALIDRAYGLDLAQIRQTHPPSTLSLARLINHMALVERSWFCDRFAGLEVPEIDLDWDADYDAEMTLAESMTIDELMAGYHDAVVAARSQIEEADSLDRLSVRSNRDGEHWSLRWIVVHMIEEYARHCGHADLIRESIDGDVVS